MKKTINTILTSIIILLLVGCGTSKDPSKPPRGFPSEGLVKAAVATKMLKLIDTEPEIPSELEVFENLEYKTVDSLSMQLDIYRKKGLTGKTPVLIFIHGGAWRTGKRSDYLPYLVDYAMKGYITATVSYRLMRVAKYPAAVEDVKCAVAWIREHAADYGIDPDRMALVGGSAGGHLSMMVGYDPSPGADSCRIGNDHSVKVVVNIYGPTDLTTPYSQGRYEVKDFLNTTWEENPGLFHHASPKTYISSDDPATMIFHGTLDSLVPISQSDSLKSWLDQAGVKCEYHRLKGWPHTMDLALKVNRYFQYHMDRFFEENL